MVTLLLTPGTVIEVTEQDLGFTSQEWDAMREDDKNEIINKYLN